MALWTGVQVVRNGKQLFGWQSLPGATMSAETDYMEPPVYGTAAEDRIRSEMAAAFSVMEQATEEEKPVATSRLNQTVRQLFDFVGYGKLPSDWRFNRSVPSPK